MPVARTPEECKAYHENNLMEYLKKNAEQKGKGISETTAKSYMYRIKRVFKLAFPEKTFKNKAFLHKYPTKVITAINNSGMPPNSILATYSAILSCYGKETKRLKNGKRAYQKEFDKYKDMIKTSTETQVKSKKQVERWVGMDEINEKRDAYFDKIKQSKKPQDHLKFFMFALFTLLPPRRAIDYGNMKINPDKGFDGNAFITDSKGLFKQFVFRQYKLSKSKGEQIFDRDYMADLPHGDEILFLLDNWGKAHKGEDAWFLGKQKSANLMSKSIKSISNEILGKPVNINILRHIYISDFLASPAGTYFNEKEDVANYMGHSASMQELYRKREKPDEKEDGGQKEENVEKEDS